MNVYFAEVILYCFFNYEIVQRSTNNNNNNIINNPNDKNNNK